MSLLPISVDTARSLRKSARYGQPLMVEDGIVLVLANNAGDYTGPGTNTYILGSDRLWIIDPGPDDAAHIDAVIAAVGGRKVAGILVTHSHLDHSPAGKRLKEKLDCPIYANETLSPVLMSQTEEDIDPDFEPDLILGNGDRLTGGDDEIIALHTPGHFPNHLAYYMPRKNILFTGDHIMGWSTTVIVPPLGDLADYLISVKRLETIGARLMLPSHGPMIENPAERCAELRHHRLTRHKMILTCLDDDITDPVAIRDAIYPSLPDRLLQAAIGQVRAHLGCLDRIDDLCAPPGQEKASQAEERHRLSKEASSKARQAVRPSQKDEAASTYLSRTP